MVTKFSLQLTQCKSEKTKAVYRAELDSSELDKGVHTFAELQIYLNEK